MRAFTPFKNMALHFTKEIFVMLFVFAMVGSHVYFHLAVYVVNLSLQNCPCGQFHSIHHNELRDITALLTEVCHALRNRTLPTASNPLSGEQLKYKTADGARLDVVAENIWSKNRLKAFFDVKVFNPFSKSYANTPLAQCHRHLEQDKRKTVLKSNIKTAIPYY